MSSELTDNDKRLDASIGAAIVDLRDRSTQMVFDLTLCIDAKDTNFVIVSPQHESKFGIDYARAVAPDQPAPGEADEAEEASLPKDLSNSKLTPGASQPKKSGKK